MNAGLLGEHLASPRTATKTNQSTALDSPAASRGAPSDQSGFASFVTRDTDPSPTDEAHSARSLDGHAPDAIDVSPEAAVPNLTIDVEAETDTSVLALPSLANAEAETAPILSDRSNSSDIEGARTNIIADDIVPLAGASETQNADLTTTEPRSATRSDVQHKAFVADETDPAKSAETPVIIKSDAADSADTELATDPSARLRADSGRAEADLARAPAPSGTSEQVAIAASESRQTQSADATQLDRTAPGSLSRDVAVVSAEPIINIGPSTTPSAPTAAPAGLTPTAPSIPLAMPNEITGIILNALNNGVDPQEQLVVQLDPPELGRVMIDFKFDAQGLQQITVTSENPEALKRLRELHFELTQALREHGLSEQNMSFRQQADDQSQESWTSSGSNDRDLQFSAAEERRASLSATPTAPRVQPKDRLDLLL